MAIGEHEQVLAQRLKAAIETLEAIARDRTLLQELTVDERTRLLSAAGDVFDPDVVARRRAAKELRRRKKNEKLAEDEATLAETGIRVLRAKPVFTTPNYELPVEVAEERETLVDQHCYVCKKEYATLHPFYDQMCKECGDFNFAKRSETADLSGRVALLTGGRVKIGYQAGIKLLRAGASLIVTTRFPRDAAQRYAQEPDFAEWGDRLEIFGLDLRHTPSVENFCHHLLTTRDRLDFIISNACQTVRRPPEFYRHMMEGEKALDSLPARVQDLIPSAEMTQIPLLPEDALEQSGLFPAGLLDQDLQQVDLRERNSWRLLLDEVSTVELLETQLVNAVAPFVLNARLKPLMLATPERDKHIVNVSAVEGQFYRKFKTTRHPHTNMAKAALNMMTRTSAADYFNDGIHMNSVDTGWVTDEDPAYIAERKTTEHRFAPPLDIVDGAARIVDPIIVGFNMGHHPWGQFFKDYKPTDW
jgi:NAD(P)-dependent dehydrogenase (short-subunit alcohol dehydrogenase family)